MHKTTSRLVQMLSEKMLSDCKENEYMYQMYMRAERSMLINLIDIILINKFYGHYNQSYTRPKLDKHYGIFLSVFIANRRDKSV